jgi:hypothetical protein
MRKSSLVARLNEWLDKGSFAENTGIATIYAKDASVQSPRGSAQGLDAIIAYALTHSVSGEHTQHFATDILVELQGDSATIQANLMVYFYRSGASPHRTAGLRYQFIAVRTREGWRFSQATILPQSIRQDGANGVPLPMV